MQHCPQCNMMKNNRLFSKSYEICRPCRKAITPSSGESERTCCSCKESRPIEEFRVLGWQRAKTCNSCYVPDDPWPERVKVLPKMDFSNAVYRS